MAESSANSYMAKVENVLSEWEAHGIDASQARKRFREIVQEWLASPPGPSSEEMRKAEETLVLRDDPMADAMTFWRARAVYFAEQIVRASRSATSEKA
jgi:hypothetical protein